MGFIPEVACHAGIRATPLGRVHDSVLECFGRSSGHPVVIPSLSHEQTGANYPSTSPSRILAPMHRSRIQQIYLKPTSDHRIYTSPLSASSTASLVVSIIRTGNRLDFCPLPYMDGSHPLPCLGCLQERWTLTRWSSLISSTQAFLSFADRSELPVHHSSGLRNHVAHRRLVGHREE
ncbi:hypothetical protein BJ322DRAFT_890453 [Thelephora terrestris]|uniref:Uncharacterized protein n=1 Tax=Thelephora terrestris TaxID=56493 RepID=A0A9P6HC22_9AGAM|nr:hypothetical protein BJ322DRAFT_890453 [Thelephora terrestris]